ncbi:MAG: hypothetical protein KJS98_17340, partial [Nitrospirae bacterium]|nr:hypothetical protein [Nitrospirota bacterium]
KPAVKKAAKKPAAKKAPKKAATKIAKKRSAVAPKPALKKAVVKPVSAVSSKPAAAPAPDKKSVKPFEAEEPQKPSLSRPMGSPIPKDADFDEELGEDDLGIAGEADEDVEEELTLDGEDEDDADFLEKPEGLLDDADDYHTH